MIKKDNKPTNERILGIDKNSKNFIKFDTFDRKNIFNEIQPAHIYVCQICGRYLGSSTNLYMKHMKNIHNIDISVIPHEGKEFSRI